MSVIVEPGNPNNTHHVSLSDGETTIGLIACNALGGADPRSITRAPVNRTAMKTTTGNAKYSDYEPPWTPIAQDDWSGGRGLDDFDKDTTRYYDGNRANTMFGKIMHGPQERYCTGLRSAITLMPGNVSWWSLITGSGKYMASSFVPTSSFTAASVWLLIRRVGTPTGYLTVKIASDNSGLPGTVLKTMTVDTSSITDTLSEWWIFSISGSQALAQSTQYWLYAYADGDDSNHWEIACHTSTPYGKKSSDGSSWSASTVGLYYRFVDADSATFTKFFQYKRAMYMVRSIASAASKLYINGDRGTAQSNAGNLSTLIDVAKSWSTDEWVGCYVLVTGGTGSNEDQTWRKITANNGNTLTVDVAWEIPHDNTTEYVILGSSKWTEITGTGITKKVTDVIVVNNIIYFALGDATVIKAAKFETSAGAWTPTYRDDGTATNKATFLCTVRDPSSGNVEIWRANNISPVSSKVAVSKSALVAWGSNLSFGTESTFEDNYGKITGLEEYGDTSKYLWVFREGTIYAINAGKPDEIPLREVRTMMSDSNGKVHTIHNAYMYINLGGGLQQYYNRQLADVGTNRDEGLPTDRRGPVSGLQGYPGRLFEAIDAGAGYSQVHGWNLTGWHEHYRAPKGQRINALAYEVIPDVGLDRMWVAQGNDVVWLPFPSNTLDPSKDTNYPFAHECSMVSGWLYAGLPDVYKLYNTFKLFAENLEEDSVWVEVDYQVDDESAWTPLDGLFYVSPMTEHALSESNSITGKRLRYRIRSYTADATKTPVIKSAVVEVISRVPIKYSFGLRYRMEEGGKNIKGDPEELSPDATQGVLDGWAENLTKLEVKFCREAFGTKKVFIDPMPLSVNGENLEKYIGTVTMTEV